MEKEQASVSTNASISSGVRFAHFSDLHVGMESQSWLWPTFKKAFFDDLRRMHDKTGPLDFVVFSGDLTQKAATNEYERLTEILKELWDVFQELGFRPLLFPVPGNHDLSRPVSTSAAAKVLRQWFTDPDIQRDFWMDEASEYRSLVRSVFSGYVGWLETLATAGIPLPDMQDGALPGDVSAVLELRNQRIGLVGLNSAWLQLDAGDYKGQLHADVRQLNAVTGGDPDIWCSKNHFNLLVTHHPSDWLHGRSRDQWRSDVHTHSRFDFHLYGHMHEPSVMSVSEGGAPSRRFFQAESLFGLEKISESEVKRAHGYAIHHLSLDQNIRQIRQWPRQTLIAGDGIRKLVPNHHLNINDGGFFDLQYSLEGHEPAGSGGPNASVSPKVQPVRSLGQLKSLRRTLPASKVFIDVRRMEQAVSLAALEENRSLWLVSDWGLGSDEFIRTLQERQRVESAYIYEIDLQNYFSRSEILGGVQDQVGCSFEQLCELISLEPPCILVLDDVPISEGRDKDTHSLQKDLEFIVNAILEYCQDIKIIVKSRGVPVDCVLKVVELRPLDEADSAAYIASHSLGGPELATPQFVSQLFRHTDGIPIRINSALRDVQIVGAGELHSLNMDVAGKVAVLSSPPPGLVAAIEDMNGSSDPSVKRAFGLLKALTMFPRGEQLSTVKRFNQTSAFYSQDARILMDLAFVDAVEIISLDSGLQNDAGRALVVRRPVREYLYGYLSSTELRNLNRRALAIYFGDEWPSKGIKSPRTLRFDDRHCGSWQIGNASMMVLRTAREAVEAGSEAKLKSAHNLSCSFCSILLKGDHYGSVVSLCSDLVPLFVATEAPELDLVRLRSYYAKALRMTGEAENAKGIFVDIKSLPMPNALRQEILLGLALCYESLNYEKLAISTANECVILDPKSNRSLQAQSIVIGINKEDPNRNKKLRKLEKDARKRKAFVIANNVALDRADECEDADETENIVAMVAYGSSSAEGDSHNAMRAIIRLARMKLEKDQALDRADLTRLIDAYHYLYSESLSGLFDKCHQVLWRAFEAAGETVNLLRLFRHSSLKWRLRGKPQQELTHLAMLGKLLGNKARDNIRDADREMAYYLARAGHVMNSAKVP